MDILKLFTGQNAFFEITKTGCWIWLHIFFKKLMVSEINSADGCVWIDSIID
jgi:hypothetical protein